MNDPPLALEGLSVAYGGVPVLRSVSVELAAGTLVALAGPNGSGKTTLFRAVVGSQPSSQGRVRLFGRDAALLPLAERATTVAWMPQEEPPGDDLEVESYVRYGRSPHLGGLLPRPDPDPEAVGRALRATGTATLARRRMHALSGGERQRVRLARILAQETSVLLLDEPTSHLDIGHQLDILARVRAIARSPGRCVLVALHDLNLAARFADRVLVLSRGHLVADGPPEGILSPALLRQVWGVEAELRRDARSRVPYLLPQLLSSPSPPGGAGRFRVHVMAGGGAGVELLPRLVDQGYDLSAGALPLFDSDSELANELHLPSALEVPFAPLSPPTLARLRELLGASQAVVVAAFPVGPTNVGNLEEAEKVAGTRPVLLLAQRTDRPWDFTEGRATALRRSILARGGRELPDAAAAMGALEELRARSAGPTGSSAP